MRVVKEAEARRSEILDVADELFRQKGYDGTSTNDILAKVGIARGTLYYHFKSKEDIMDALIERYNVRLIGAAQKVAANQNIPILDRIIHVVMALNISGGSSQEVMHHIHKPQNALMHQKIQQVIINRVTPILTEIIREGTEQGLFHTPFPYECMEMVVVYANTIFDHDKADRSNEELAACVRAFVFNLERLLGAESGSMMNLVQIFDKGDGSRDA